MLVERFNLGYASTLIYSQISEHSCLGRQEAHPWQISLWSLICQCILNELALRAAIAFGSCCQGLPTYIGVENAVCSVYMPPSTACLGVACKEESSENWNGGPELSTWKPGCALLQNVVFLASWLFSPWWASISRWGHKEWLRYPCYRFLNRYLLEKIIKPFWLVKPPGKKVRYSRLASPH